MTDEPQVSTQDDGDEQRNPTNEVPAATSPVEGDRVVDRPEENNAEGGIEAPSASAEPAEPASTEAVAPDAQAPGASGNADTAPTEPPAHAAAEPSAADEAPVAVASAADASEQPPQPATAETPAPAAAETSAADEAPVANVEKQSAGEQAVAPDQSANDAAAATPEAQAAERPSAKLRDKLGAGGTGRARGSEDILSQRPEMPTDTQNVEIPEGDELDESLEAEISSAFTEEVLGGQKTPAAVDGETAQPDETKPAPVSEGLAPGQEITGTIEKIHGDDVFVNAGTREDVVTSLKQFPEDKQPAVGDAVTVVIESLESDGLYRARLPQARTQARGNWDGLAAGQIVDCLVTAKNKGGLQVEVGSLRGFLPASQVDLNYVEDLEAYVGQKLTCQITEVNPRKKNLIVSRRALLQAERESQQGAFWESLEPGQDLTGTVKTIKNYGAFVDLGPVDGFLHIGEMSWSRINHPNEVLQTGQQIQVRVLKVEPERNRISLGLKQLVQNPWVGLSDRYPSERIVTGKVTRITDFGAFVELEPGVEGLVHISQLAWRRVGSVNEVLSVGDEREFQVLEVDQKRRRVSLSLKALEKKPEAPRREENQDEQRQRSRRRQNPDLRGGMGENNAGGGLFGNPTDFT